MKQKTKTWFYTILLSMIGIVFSNKISAQTTFTFTPDAENWKCGMDSAIMAQLANDTGFVGRMGRYNYGINNPPPNTPQSGAPYIVPVVFHLLGATTPTITYAQIRWQLARINAAFRNQMNLFNGQANGARAVNTQIEFRLACITSPTNQAWSNAAEPGVMRYGGVSTTVQNQITLSPTTFTPMLAITHSTTAHFPFANYLNIWCVPNIDAGTTIGYGTFPWMNAGIDGVVMDIDVIGNNSYPTNFPLMGQLDKGAILVHEFGHYLGLYHTFQPLTAGCTTSPVLGNTLGCFGTTAGTGACEGDLILDTPPTKIAQDLGSVSLINTCNETNFPYGGFTADQPDQLENYMSYSDDDRMTTFTQGQANRMISTFTTTVYGNRFNLNNPTNLIATGVNPNSCSNLSGLLTAMFNYSIAAVNGCNGANVQFIVPTSLGFTTAGTTYNWTFGDGGTGTGINPTHTYATPPSTFVVSLSVLNGTMTANFTRTITVPGGQTSIVKQSGNGIRVCKGSEQTIFVRFANNVPSAILTDGTNTYTVSNNYYPWNNPPTATQVVPYTFTVSNVGVFTYSMVPAICGTVNLGTATFTVTECCNNVIANGDLEAGNTGFYTDHCMPANDKTASPGTSAVNFDNLVFSGGPVNLPPSGKIMFIDGCTNAVNAGCNVPTNTVPFQCNNPGVRKVFFGQVISGLQPNTQYYVSFKSTEHAPTSISFCDSLRLGLRILNGSSTLITQNNLIPTIVNDIGGINNKRSGWHVFNFNFTTAATVTPVMSYSLEVYQMDRFSAGAYDYGVDNFLLQALTPGIQAVGTTTICKGATAALTATANCGLSLANYNFAWTPTTGLSSPTTMNTNASPTVTTTYTLVATPTSTIGGLPSIISTVLVTVIPTFTVNPASQIIYAGGSATMTAVGSTGTYSWMPGPLTGSVVTVSPSSTTIYTVTNAISGTCSVINPTVVVSTACSQTAAASYSNFTVPSGTYTAAGTVVDLAGTITFTGSTSFTGYTMRMAPGTLLYVAAPGILTLDNCKLYGCTELWQGIQLEYNPRQGSIDVKNGTTIEDMYAGIYRLAATTNTSTQGIININNSKLNKNYVSVQLISVPGSTVSGTAYNLTVKNSTITTESSITSPGFSLKPSTIPSYTYAYNQIAGGASGGTTSYTAFPRGFIGINLYNLSTNHIVVIGDSAGSSNTFNTFSNLDIGILATNAQLRVHNNYFYNLKGSTKQIYFNLANPTPTPIGPDEIGVGIVAQHTVANTYSLQVGTKTSAPVIASLAYPKSNAFKTINKGIYSKNCNLIIAKGNFFDADTTDEPSTDFFLPGATSPTYNYYKAQSAVWVSALGTGGSITNNYIKNYRAGIYASITLSVTSGSYLNVKSNTVLVNNVNGYCRNGINLEQVGGANMPASAIEVSVNNLNKVYNGINAKAILAGLYVHDNTSITLDNVKLLGKGSVPTTYSNFGITLSSVQNGRVEKNQNINGIGSITASNYSLTNAVYVITSTSNTITCNSANNVGRGFYFQGNCSSPNGWLGNSISNSYRGLELKTSGMIGTQGTTPSGTLAANTWSNVTQETFVSTTTNANTASNMFVEANGTYTTAPSLNFGTAGQIYINAPAAGIDIKTGTPFDCGGGGCGGCLMGAMSSGGSLSSGTNNSNDAMYSNLVTANTNTFPQYPEENIFQNQLLVYKLQKQGQVAHNASNPSLQNFYANNQNSNIGKFIDAQDALANNQRALAVSKNNNIAPANNVQQKTKLVNELMFKLNNNPYYTYSNTELQDLFSMADECSVKGWYVTQSRNILNAISGYLRDYADNCEDGKSKSRTAGEDETAIITEPNRSFNLFPNPNNGSMIMFYDLGADKEAELNLYDVTGKLINNYILQNGIGNIEINEAQLQNGIYFYRILVKGKIIHTNKVVIIK